jgi:ubiquinone/menaquinone biosynthesis C-methylase UbiE
MQNSHPSMSEHNQKVYDNKKIAFNYLHDASLYPAEKELIDWLSPRLPEMRMLDIGIGGGRTTAHFANRVKQYIGIDYAAAMIETCQNRFPQRAQSTEFRVGDVRDLGAFTDQAFDLVLFSYNGLDYIPHEERLKALAEMARVTKSGGLLVFSSHNLMGFGQSPRPKKESWTRRMLIKSLLMLANGRTASLRTKPYSIIRDDGLGFRLKTYYVRPSEQLRQLSALGLNQVDVYGIGGNLLSQSQAKDQNMSHSRDQSLDLVRDEWLYYFATR